MSCLSFEVPEIFKAIFVFILVATLLFVTGEKAIHHLFSRDTPYELGYAYVLQYILLKLLSNLFSLSFNPKELMFYTGHKIAEPLDPSYMLFPNAVHNKIF